MNRSRWLVGAAVLVALLAGWLIGRATHSVGNQATPASNAAPTRKILYYRNAMGLPDTSPVPKKDSMGMDYVPVFEGGEKPSASDTVELSPQKVQKLGVRTVLVRLKPLSPTLRASATVQVDETRQYVIAPRFEGWVEHLYANQTGMAVRRGQALLSIYSPALVAAQSEYLIADSAARKMEKSDPESAATMRRLRDASRARLRNWNISDAQLVHLGHDQGSDKLILTSPANAVVVEKPIVEGARFAPGETILRLADLSTVWLVANVPASGSGAVSVGQRATFQSSSLPGKTFSGLVTFVQPMIDLKMRSLGVRVELPNPDGMLRPGLFGDVTLVGEASAAVLSVPRSSVLDSGTRQLVLVQVGEGRFEPRTVVLGARSGDEVEIREGLVDGERVVVSANFLIDAESNLKSALEGMNSKQDPGTSAAAMTSDARAPDEASAKAHKADAVDGSAPMQHEDAAPPSSEPMPGMEMPPSIPADHSGHGDHPAGH